MKVADRGTVTEPDAVADADQRASLSTQPAPVDTRRRRGALGWLRLGWRRLTSMRTALQLLFLLSLAAIPGGLLPQRGQEAARVTAYLSTHRTLGPLFDRASLFDVFKAPWFAAIYLLLFVSLIGCLAPRIRLHARALRKPPPRTPANLARLPGGSVRFSTDRPPPEVLAAAAPLLKGWRVAQGTDTISAERGYARETGNLIFHVALVLLLIGVAIGSLFGYEADRVVADGPVTLTGTSFTNTPIAYDQYRPGGLVSDGSLAAWTLHLDQFRATYRPDGSPADYVAHTVFTPAGGTARPVDIKVNHPLQAGSGTKVYLLNHGYAPVFALKDAAGRVVQRSQPIICAPIETTNLLSRCVVSFAGLPPAADGSPADLAFDIELAPTGRLVGSSQLISTSPVDAAPALAVVPYVGNLGHPVNVESLDFTLLKPVSNRIGAILPDDPKLTSLGGLPGGYALTVDGPLHQWASFQVKRDPAKRLVLLAAIGIVAGLLLSLRVRRRRLFLRVRAAPAGPAGAAARTVVEVGGLARSDVAACRVELEGIVARLRESTGAVAEPPDRAGREHAP